MPNSRDKKKLRIAQMAPLWFPIPPHKYGGIERVVSLLTEELVRRGHDVTLFAAPGSMTSAKLVSVFPQPLIEAGGPWSSPVWNLRNLSKAFEMAHKGEFDIIHSHLDLWTLFFQGVSDVPILHTMHNPLYRTNADATKDDRLRLFSEEASRTNLTFISESARRFAMVQFPRNWIVYNGIDISHFEYNENGGDHFVWIARVNKHKGIESAIEAAEKLGVKLILAGRIDPTQQEYFDTTIKPHLNDSIKYIGELTEKELSEFYGSAKALLYPIEWEEPFGLIVAEAMACGTPVIAYKRGSMPELIKDGETGFVVDSNMHDLIEAMKNIDKIDRAKVRKYAEENFSKERMADDYEKIYYELAEANSQ